MHPVRTLQLAVRHRDFILGNRAMAALKEAGLNSRECYRLALAGNEGLTRDTWEDFTKDLDEAAAKK